MADIQYELQILLVLMLEARLNQLGNSKNNANIFRALYEAFGYVDGSLGPSFRHTVVSLKCMLYLSFVNNFHTRTRTVFAHDSCETRQSGKSRIWPMKPVRPRRTNSILRTKLYVILTLHREDIQREASHS